MTDKQKTQFNSMLFALVTIKTYESPNELRKNSEKNWGLEYHEALEMAYENMQENAKEAIRNVKPIK